MSLENALTKSWYRRLGWTWVLCPLLFITAPIVFSKRRTFLKHRNTQAYRSRYPVIVVGNITVGGTGKSPMVIALCSFLKSKGWNPGVITRGHKRETNAAVLVSEASSALEVGDEPLMLARRTGCPISVSSNRALAIKMLEELDNVDIIISDDGLQHYAIDRDIEIVMVDSQRGLGNKQLLPVGPLREPAHRLSEVDCVFSINQLPLVNCSAPVFSGPIKLTQIRHIKEHQKFSPLTSLHSGAWHVVAGIGNPSRFWDALLEFGLSKASKFTYFSDHHQFKREDLPDSERVIMTEKDAVKVEAFAKSSDEWWYASAELLLPENFKQFITRRLSQLSK
ncbi:tetraacyldisaccharide 4'-kinase [Marinomonas ostreistagni]|uniref:Tetraacyldisaccharide 4'-kinase n=1 Tax=Marinomonas ostreistagni TaxID=359209 RepID=A0ABS0Z8V9_9GAMM|nr:tetraacyldisaccharide 4'-kinase [Marinomonas ostreistagni]MBJ7549441.1 tetraacyldisaccharide 4'-kinase [Marinomonas ostreistagni]